jgi:hypothetical protein
MDSGRLLGYIFIQRLNQNWRKPGLVWANAYPARGEASHANANSKLQNRTKGDKMTELDREFMRECVKNYYRTMSEDNARHEREIPDWGMTQRQIDRERWELDGCPGKYTETEEE